MMTMSCNAVIQVSDICCLVSEMSINMSSGLQCAIDLVLKIMMFLLVV